METSYTNDFNLLCDDGPKSKKLMSMIYLGNAFGQILWGTAQDLYGRRTVLVGCGTIT